MTPPPTGLRLVLFLLLIIGIGALASSLQLLRAAAGGGAIFPITWLLLVIGVLSFVAAGALWWGWKGARYLFLAWALSNLAWQGLIAYGVAAMGGAVIGWVLAGIMALGAVALAAVLVRYVWRLPDHPAAGRG
ncbi:MAG: hypothetical protein ACHQ2E_11045 [Gemmatimonadales bacterium]